MRTAPAAVLLLLLAACNSPSGGNDIVQTAWRTYDNPAQAVRFSYPEGLAVTTDGIHRQMPRGRHWYRMQAQDGTHEQQPMLTFEVNPDGYGPIFADRVYTLTEHADGSIAIIEERVFTPESAEDPLQDGWVIITAGPLASRNGNQYYWRWEYREGRKDLQPVFQYILGGVRIARQTSGVRR